MSEKKAGLKEIYPVILITIIVAVSMTLLIMVDTVTRDLIEENKRAEFEKNLKVQFPKLDHYVELEDLDVYIVENETNATLGYAFTVIGKGYGGEIEMLVGIENDAATIRGLSVITHGETPGLGAKITEPWFQEQFQGKSVNDLALTKDGGEIDAITGATISSSAVVDAVKEAALAKIQALKDEGVI